MVRYVLKILNSPIGDSRAKRKLWRTEVQEPVQLGELYIPKHHSPLIPPRQYFSPRTPSCPPLALASLCAYPAPELWGRAGFYSQDSKSIRTSLLHFFTWRRVIKTGSVNCLSDFDSSAGYELPLMDAVPDVSRRGLQISLEPGLETVVSHPQGCCELGLLQEQEVLSQSRTC